MNRRQLLRTAAAGLLAGLRPVFAADAEIEVSPQSPGPEISPHLYGHFIEHLGAVIYDGIWVGRDSKVANIDGIRRRFVDDMKRIGAPNFRWPGGCFADGYHWRDGIGRGARPRTYNYWQASLPPGLDHTETNQFGLHEFMRLCRLTGAEPYLAANVGSGSPREFHEWLLYCNAPNSTVSLAAERAANGDAEPFAVKWWGVGNESWGCGGDMTPQEYAAHYRNFVTQIPAYPPRPYLVAVGPRGHSRDYDIGWTTGFFQSMQEGHRSRVDGFSLHYYTDFRNSPERVGNFDSGGWYSVLSEGLRTESVIEHHWAEMAKFDAAHRTKLILDEWGVWYRTGEETAPAHILSQPLTLRDALHTAVTFDVFNRHADKLAMCNVAQTINCIHSLFLAQGDRFVRTPVYSVFEMYQPHMGGRALPVKLRCDELTVSAAGGGTAKMPGVSGSASLRQERLALTLTNPSFDSPLSARVRLTSGNALEARGTILTHAAANAHNTFDRPDEVKLAPMSVGLRNGAIELAIPPHAIVGLEVRVG
jgi:alpha-N-arabinofuranosidase